MIIKNSFPQYQAVEALNISSLVNIKKSPEAFKWHLNNREETASLTIGRLLHTLILEPETVGNTYAIEPNKKDFKFVTVDDIKPLLELHGLKKTGKKEDLLASLRPFLSNDEIRQVYDFTLQAFNLETEGKEKVSAKDFDKCVEISSKVLADLRISKMLRHNGQPEISIEQEIDGIKVKGRVDFLSENFFLDYKSCQDCSPEAFTRDFVKYNYHTKLFFYQKILELETGKKLPCIVIAQSKEENCDFMIYEVSQEFLDLGEVEFNKMFETYKACVNENNFPPMDKSIQVLTPPVWLK